jgi:L-threonylcarbamoyladenylate synthase
MSEVFDCTTPEGLAAGIEAAARAVQAGQIVVLPTDTVYGIGCDAFDGAAVSAVLAAKGRGRDMPPPVLVPNARTVDGLARSVPEYVRHLIDRFWPGALTLVLESQPSLTWDLGETNGTVALRMPDHEIALALLGQAGPMAVTSANLTGRPPAQSVAEAQEQLGASVAVYLDGGTAPGGYASTILDCTGGAPLTLREGALTRAEVDTALDEAEKREAAEAARRAAVAAAAAEPPPARGRSGPRIAGSRRRGSSPDR